MIAIPSRRFHVGTYNNGQPYVAARGRYAPREQVEDRLAPCHAVVDLPRQKPTATAFLQAIVRELRIRFYQQKTVKAYRNALASMLRWFGQPLSWLTPPQRERIESFEFFRLLQEQVTRRYLATKANSS